MILLSGQSNASYLTIARQHFNRRVQKFRTDYAELRTQFERLKGEVAAAVSPSALSIDVMRLELICTCDTRSNKEPVVQNLSLPPPPPL